MNEHKLTPEKNLKNSECIPVYSYTNMFLYMEFFLPKILFHYHMEGYLFLLLLSFNTNHHFFDIYYFSICPFINA